MTLAAPYYIETAHGLEDWLKKLRTADVIAVDTESDSLHHYREKVCLIQMTANGEDALIDPLALRRIDSLAEIFADPSKMKIFHDAGYDVTSLARDFGFKFANLFDTMLASRLLGQKEFGLAAILRNRYAFEANKRLQRSDWAQRPLTAEQLEYARFDTHFLPRLAEELKNELAAKGRLKWALEDFARLPSLADRAATKDPLDPNGFWRVRGVSAMLPDERGRVQALYLMRERLAEELDRPPFKVLGEDVLIGLATHPPKTLVDLNPRDGLRRSGIDRWGKDIMQALATAKPISGPQPAGAGRKRRSGRFVEQETRDLFDALRDMRREVAEKLGLDPEVTLGNAVLEDLARDPPKTRSDYEARTELQGWRRDLFYEHVAICLGL